jgi:hypothetical protein
VPEAVGWHVAKRRRLPLPAAPVPNATVVLQIRFRRRVRERLGHMVPGRCNSAHVHAALSMVTCTHDAKQHATTEEPLSVRSAPRLPVPGRYECGPLALRIAGVSNESCGARTRERLRSRGPVAIENSLRGRGASAVGSRYQATASENCEHSLRAAVAVICGARNGVRLSQLFANVQ